MDLKTQIDNHKLPKHIAVIMDGNGRWAKKRGMPRVFGHRNGVKAVREISEAGAELGVSYMTLYAFSTENWGRPSREVSLLMDLMRNVLKNDIDELNQREVRLRIIGDRSRFDADLQDLMAEAEGRTAHNVRMQLNIAANFLSNNGFTECFVVVDDEISCLERPNKLHAPLRIALFVMYKSGWSERFERAVKAAVAILIGCLNTTIRF